MFQGALLHVHGLPVAPVLHADTFTGERPDGEGEELAEALAKAKHPDLEQMQQQLRERLRTHTELLQQEQIVADWCAGAKALYSLQPPSRDPCNTLGTAAAQVASEVAAWDARSFVERVRRFQFSVAPNVSLLDSETDLLSQTAGCIFQEDGTLGEEVSSNHSAALRALGEADSQSLREERQLLVAGASLKTLDFRINPSFPEGPLYKGTARCFCMVYRRGHEAQAS